MKYMIPNLKKYQFPNIELALNIFPMKKELLDSYQRALYNQDSENNNNSFFN